MDIIVNYNDAENISPCTSVLQSAIDKCYDNGGGRVIVKQGKYITGTLIIRSNVTFVLEEGAIICGSDKLEDYPTNPASFIDAVDQERGKCLILAYKSNNISIEGSGEICGRGELFYSDRVDHNLRPFLVRIVECEDVKIKNISLTNAAAWCVHLTQCNKVSIDGITIHSRVNCNNDGIDIDSSKDIDVRNCNISSGDDGICLKCTSKESCKNIYIENCTISSDWAGFKIGTESVGDFSNIHICNCKFNDILGCAIKIVPVDGAIVDNLLIENIELTACTGPIFISTGERRRAYRGVGRTNLSAIRNVVIRNVKGTVIDAERQMVYKGKPWGNAKGEIVISGLKEEKITNILLQNLDLEMPGGIQQVINNDVPEMGEQYPEFHLFGILPSDIYVRHAENLCLKNINLSFKNKDSRPILISENVDNIISDI